MAENREALTVLIDGIKNGKIMAEKFSIWLMPSGKKYNKLKKLILSLGKKYSAPVFEPHVTLLGNLGGQKKEALKKTAYLASKIKPFKITLTSHEYLDEYFRCLFIKAKKTSNLVKAYSMAKQIFRQKSKEKFMPHLSLVYGHFPAKTKQEIISQIKTDVAMSFEINNIMLFLASKNIQPNKWREIREFKLK
mgnify:CR=1 FL=1